MIPGLARGVSGDRLNRPKRGHAALLIRGCAFTALVAGLAAAMAGPDPGSSLTRGLDVKLSVLFLPGSLFSPQ